MSIVRSAVVFSASALIVAAVARPAAAQVIIGRGRGLIVNAPGAAVRLGPIGGYGFYGGQLRGVAVAPYGVAPNLGNVPTGYGTNPAYGVAPLRRFAARPALPTNPPSTGSTPGNSAPLPSAADWRRMADHELLNNMLQTAGRLEQDLGGFTTAASWREYLRLPGDALPAADSNQRVRLRLASVAETLGRFNSAEANPEYRQITSLPSYDAMQNALGEVVRRFGGNAKSMSQSPSPAPAAQQTYAAAKPAVKEELPAPPPAVSAAKSEPTLQAPQNAAPERSILRKRK
jgi:hypothetical protein